jgi:small subunit ribosomal protein S8
MMTDPLADMLTRIRNANAIERPAAEMPATHLKKGVARVLKEEGFILDFQTGSYVKNSEGHQVFEASEDLSRPKMVLRVFLKYGPDGERVIRHIRRVSRPGCRIYRRSTQLPRVLDGLGISIVSTNRGVMSDRQARAAKLGGELLANVW